MRQVKVSVSKCGTIKKPLRTCELIISDLINVSSCDFAGLTKTIFGFLILGIRPPLRCPLSSAYTFTDIPIPQDIIRYNIMFEYLDERYFCFLYFFRFIPLNPNSIFLLNVRGVDRKSGNVVLMCLDVNLKIVQRNKKN